MLQSSIIHAGSAAKPKSGTAVTNLAASVVLILVAFLCYASSFHGPFVFDDRASIVDNPTLRSLWPPSLALAPPRGEGLTVEGRPVLNLSFALNFAFGGTSVFGYHLANIGIHAFTAIVLFHLLRGTLDYSTRRESHLPNNNRANFKSAAAITLLWIAHPLHTAAVTYIVQRAESLMGLFLVSMLYAFHRAVTAAGSSETNLPVHTRKLPFGWCAGAVLACTLGMATKEVMVGAPLIALFYDRTFISASFRDAWRRHSTLYMALVFTWLLLGWLALGAGDRGGTIGAAAGVTPWQYAVAQSRGIVHYIGLVLWPSPLIFDYGPALIGFDEALPYIILLAGLLLFTARALFRGSAVGFWCASFFVILSPTSSFVGGYRQMLAEHRMYLPSICVVALGVFGMQRGMSRLTAPVVLACAGAFALLTINRNGTYRTELKLYEDTVSKRPQNPFAQYNLGKLLAESGRIEAAIAADREAVKLRPGLLAARLNLANALRAVGKWDEAIDEYRAVIEMKPDYAIAHYNLANALIRLDRKLDAAEHYRIVIQLSPGDLDARDNLGAVLMDSGRLAEAEAEFQEVLRIDPARAETHCNLGSVYFIQGRLREAAQHYERALQIRPDFTLAREGLARLRR
jgi:protein O-mannosyl-transferase